MKFTMDIKSTSELIAIILIVCWVAKQTGLNGKFIPLLAIILGGAGAYVLGGNDWLTTIYGVFSGLATTLGYREVSKSLE